jgi:hypothetical protein
MRTMATIERSVDGETNGARDVLELERLRLEVRAGLFFVRAMLRPPR